MKVLVDTTVWIDFFSANPYQHVKTLDNLIVNKDFIPIEKHFGLKRFKYFFHPFIDKSCLFLIGCNL